MKDSRMVQTVTTGHAIEIDGLVVAAGFEDAQKTLLHGASLSIPRGTITCLVGESGSGKTILIKTVLGVTAARPGPVAGAIRALGQDGSVVSLLDGLSPVPDPHGGVRVPRRWYQAWHRRLKPFWGAQWGFIAQHGARSLDPTRPVGQALIEAVARRHGRRSGRKRWIAEACTWLERLRFDQPDRVLSLYPRQLSGGMAQRFAIAVALARGAKLLFADEPTTGLDPDAQEALIETIGDLRAQNRLETLVLITHDLELAHRLASQIAVMHRGEIVESQPRDTFFGAPGPQSPHGAHLLQEFQRLTRASARTVPLASGAARLTVRRVRKHYTYRSHWWSPPRRKQVLEKVDFDIHPGEIVGLVGPSGSGKTTLARVVGRLTPPDRGVIRLESSVLTALEGEALRRKRRRFQLLFQQVTAAIHPRMRVEEALRETATHVMGLDHDAAAQAVEQALTRFHIEHCRAQFPAELSGGECRAVGLARAMMVDPVLLIADEPTAGIDASLRADLLDQLVDFVAQSSRPSILLISHDRQVMKRVANRVLRLDGGVLMPAGVQEGVDGVTVPEDRPLSKAQRGYA